MERLGSVDHAAHLPPLPHAPANREGTPEPDPASAARGGERPRADSVQLSRRALAAGERDADEPSAAHEEEEHGEAPTSGSTDAQGNVLTKEEEARVRELRARDREVRAHEQAHLAAAGGLATGGPSYELERGPDGVDYAVGGEVGISLSEGRTPEETIQRAEQARRAALAPAQPSGQDRAVAAQASQMAARARAELRSANEESEEPSAPGREEQAAATYAAAGAESDAGSALIDVVA